MKDTHAEAFAVMRYRCGTCRTEEIIWNSRDGVTPFCVDCRMCGLLAEHVEWSRDRRDPLHDSAPGDRYFRDGMHEEARAILRERLRRCEGTPYEVPEDEWEDVIAATLPQEFRPGWPKLVVRGSDQDTLSPPNAMSGELAQTEAPAPRRSTRDGGEGMIEESGELSFSANDANIPVDIWMDTRLHDRDDDAETR